MQMIPAAHHGGHTNLPPTRVVIHATCPDVGFPSASKAGRAESTARYFQSTSRAASAHVICDVSTTIRAVPDDVVAYHAPPNSNSLGVEICADGGARASFANPAHAYSREDWLSPQVWPAVAAAARQVRAWCDRYRIPIRRLSVAQVRAGERGICGHNEVSEAFHKSGHDDPGPAFPWDRFIAEVKHAGSTTSTTGGLSMSDVQDILKAIQSAKEQAHHDAGTTQRSLSNLRSDVAKTPDLTVKRLLAIKWGDATHNLGRLLGRVSTDLSKRGIGW